MGQINGCQSCSFSTKVGELRFEILTDLLTSLIYCAYIGSFPRDRGPIAEMGNPNEIMDIGYCKSP